MSYFQFPTNKTRMWNWKVLYNRQTVKNWLLQCCWVLFSLQQCVWNHGLLVPLLFLSTTAFFLTEEGIQRGSKKRELDALRRHYVQEKGFKVNEKWECKKRRLYKTTKTVKQFIRENFPYRRSLAAEEHFLKEIKKGNLFRYVQCDIEVPENLKSEYANFRPILKNTTVSKSDIGDLTGNCAEEKKITVSSLKNVDIKLHITKWNFFFTPLLFFYLKSGLVCTKTHRFVGCNPRKCYNSFVKSAVDARRQVDENPNSSVVAETMKLLANSSYGYQIMHRSRHTVTKYLTDKKHMRLLILNCSKS